MLFNSVQFALFLPLVLLIYWSVCARRLKRRNAFILVASYLFYGLWDWRFLSLIIISSLSDYSIALWLAKTTKDHQRKILLACSVAVNIGILFTFKYFGFFVDSLVGLLGVMGISGHISTFQLVLPVGISFYTFQTLGYTIDVYRKKLEPEQSAVTFLAFVSFFPQLVAGPIERASNLLPQFKKLPKVNGNMVRSGLRLMLWGLFKKVVIADQLAPMVDDVFAQSTTASSLTLALGALYFAIQIYCDFSGYSDIAIGCARLFGFRLLRNFNFPYFSKSVPEFWKRWHISLSTWFRDYVYLPLGGNRGSKLFQLRNVLITFGLSGLWHGANWTFVVWGLLNGLYFIPRIFGQHIQLPRHVSLLKSWATLPAVFAITCLTWVFFRASSLEQALHFITGLLSFDVQLPAKQLLKGLPLVFFILAAEYLWQTLEKPLQWFMRIPMSLRWATYLLCCITISRFMLVDRSFIYFQF